VNEEKKIGTLYCDPPSNNARAILSDLDVNFTHQIERADLIWMRKEYDEKYRALNNHQLLNHIPGERAMTNKGHLTWNLKKYTKKQSPDASSPKHFYPESYCLYRTDDCDAFFSQLPPQDSPDNLWILKPTYLSSGKGIRIIWQFDELKQQHQTPRFPYGKDDKYIIQKYIQNPLLLNDRKSEIRIYWLIASLSPLLVFLYKEGTTRLTTQPFQLDDFDNPLIHVTNIDQQKNHPEYDTFALKWPFSQLESYLTHESKHAKPNFIEEHLKPHIKKTLSHVVRATRHLLCKSPPRGLFFGLYGADFILDDTLYPYLTEIQKGPGLSYNDEIKKRVIPPMLQEAVQIVLEIQKRKRNNQPLTHLKSINGFEPIRT